MEIVTGAMRSLIPKLAALLSDEYKLQRNLKKDIQFLKAQLETMQAVLVRVSEAPVTDKQDSIWARDVRELSYDIEDIIDKFMVLVDTDPTAQTSVFIKRCLRLLSTANLRYRITREIIGTRKLVIEVAERCSRYNKDNVPFMTTAISTTDPRLAGNYEETKNLIGISVPKNELIELLTESEPMVDCCLRVISIVGVGGLGKTTVAKAVYHQLRGQFECHAFVSVSLNPDFSRILRSILRHVSEKDYGSTEAWPIEEIIEKIRQFLADKRYIIILDDIWDKLAWKHIRCALVDNNYSSKIITTTRVHDVAVSCSEVDGAIYKLKNLSQDDSRKLFYKRIFGSEDDIHSELKEVSEKILSKCGGVPLAINTIASLLANIPTNIHQWHDVHNSIGSGLQKSHSLENMRNILSISYYGLASHLKACFLYLSTYPEDYSILRDQLIRRWISEGFVQGEDVVTSYEIGEKYFNELINRSLIEPDHLDAHGRVLACRVHDMILDLITSLSSEENFMTALHDQKSTNVPNTIRRLSFQRSTDGHAILKASNLSHLRSLVVFPQATNLLPPLANFHVLRVLDFEGCNHLEACQIDGVVTLFHLRCLVLKDTNIRKLPKEIGKLGCLQTLDLRNTNINELPSTVIQLRQLLRLYIDRSVTVPVGFGGLRSLQALSYIGICESLNIKELGNLTSLRILHISISAVWHTSSGKSPIDSLCNLKKLHELCIVGGVISKLPRWIKSTFLCLRTLDVKLGKLQQGDLQNLGALKCLYGLNLTVVEIESESLVVGIDQVEFQSLVFIFHSQRTNFPNKTLLTRQRYCVLVMIYFMCSKKSAISQSRIHEGFTLVAKNVLLQTNWHGFSCRFVLALQSFSWKFQEQLVHSFQYQKL